MTNLLDVQAVVSRDLLAMKEFVLAGVSLLGESSKVKIV
jgi:hypothetical protein